MGSDDNIRMEHSDMGMKKIGLLELMDDSLSDSVGSNAYSRRPTYLSN